MTSGADPAEFRYPLTRPLLLSTEQFARRSGLHPELVLRFTALGLLRAERDAAGRVLLHPDQIAVVARIQRLRSGLSLNYAAVGVVMDLLDRITELETTLHQRQSTPRPSTAQRPTAQRSTRWT